MLTQEEYDDYIKEVTAPGEIFLKHHLELLKKYVEKPLKKVKVGDIYLGKNNSCWMEVVSKVTENSFVTNNGYTYAFTGKSMSGIYNELDMSKVYKLIELEE